MNSPAMLLQQPRHQADLAHHEAAGLLADAYVSVELFELEVARIFINFDSDAAPLALRLTQLEALLAPVTVSDHQTLVHVAEVWGQLEDRARGHDGELSRG